MTINKFSIKNLYRKAIIKLEWFVEDIIWDFKKHVKKKITVPKNRINLTIGITTFLDRYTSCFIPLIEKISFLFPDCQIIVVANGHVKVIEQEIFMGEIKKFCERFENVQLLSYSEPRGLSHIWNQIVLMSVNHKVLIINDDLNIKVNFRNFIGESGILNCDIALINSSWSHFLISKFIFYKVGNFDEKFLEIGGEDDDYAARLALFGIQIMIYMTDSIKASLGNKKRKLRFNSYGKDMVFEKNGYSTKNSDYLVKKWETGQEYFEGSILVPNRNPRFWKLRQTE